MPLLSSRHPGVKLRSPCLPVASAGTTVHPGDDAVGCRRGQLAPRLLVTYAALAAAAGCDGLACRVSSSRLPGCRQLCRRPSPVRFSTDTYRPFRVLLVLKSFAPKPFPARLLLLCPSILYLITRSTFFLFTFLLWFYKCTVSLGKNILSTARVCRRVGGLASC